MTKQHQLCFETLANELRLQIIDLLREKPRNVSEIAKETGAERSRVSHSLKVLRSCNFVLAKKEGRAVIYELNEDSPIVQKKKGNLFTIIQDHACNCKTCHKHGEVPEFK